MQKKTEAHRLYEQMISIMKKNNDPVKALDLSYKILEKINSDTLINEDDLFILLKIIINCGDYDLNHKDYYQLNDEKFGLILLILEKVTTKINEPHLDEIMELLIKKENMESMIVHNIFVKILDYTLETITSNSLDKILKLVACKDITASMLDVMLPTEKVIKKVSPSALTETFMLTVDTNDAHLLHTRFFFREQGIEKITEKILNKIGICNIDKALIFALENNKENVIPELMHEINSYRNDAVPKLVCNEKNTNSLPNDNGLSLYESLCLKEQITVNSAIENTGETAPPSIPYEHVAEL